MFPLHPPLQNVELLGGSHKKNVSPRNVPKLTRGLQPGGWVLGFRVIICYYIIVKQPLGFRVQGLGFRVQGLGFQDEQYVNGNVVWLLCLIVVLGLVFRVFSRADGAPAVMRPSCLLLICALSLLALLFVLIIIIIVIIIMITTITITMNISTSSSSSSSSSM